MAGNLPPGQQNSLTGTLLNGRALIDVNGFKLDLGTLGGTNTWMTWGEINDRGQIVGYSETSEPDPNGEDICGFGTHRTCRPFIWEFLHMHALPTLGGNNGEASAINNRGQTVGFAENGALDTSCPPGTTNNQIALPVRWEKGNAQALPLVGSDLDGFAFWINDKGEAVGYSGTCTAALHGVSWEHVCRGLAGRSRRRSHKPFHPAGRCCRLRLRHQRPGAGGGKLTGLAPQMAPCLHLAGQRDDQP